MKLHTILLWLLLVVLTSGSTVQAVIRPLLRELEQDSSVICVALVSAVKAIQREKKGIQNPDLLDKVIEADLEVKQVLKGDVPQKACLQCFRRSYVNISPGLYLLFLDKRGTKYIPHNPHYFFIPLYESALTVPQGSGLIEVLTASIHGGQTRVEKFDTWGRNVVAINIRAIVELGGVKAKEIIYPLTNDSNAQIRGTILLSFLKLRNYSFIKETIQFAKAEHKSHEVRNVATEIAMEIGNIRDKSLLPTLHKLSMGEHSDLRRFALWALSDIGDERSVPYLMGGLTNAELNLTVRYHCLRALCKITRRRGPGGIRNFLKESDKYIDEWRLWWEENKQKYEVKEEEIKEPPKQKPMKQKEQKKPVKPEPMQKELKERTNWHISLLIVACAVVLGLVIYLLIRRRR